MPKIILISGKAESGKDFTANILKNHLETNHNLKCLILHYSDYIKHIAKTIYNWNGKKDKCGRTLLQSIGKKYRNFDKNFFVDIIINLIKIHQNDYDCILIPDVRQTNEITEIKKNFSLNKNDVLTIRVNTKNQNSLTESQKKDISETQLDNYQDFHIVIENNKTKKYKEKLIEIFEYFL